MYGYEGCRILWYRAYLVSSHSFRKVAISVPAVLGIVINLGKIFHHFVPRRAADVLQNDDWRLVLLDPLEHPSERTSRLAIGFDILLRIVEVRVIDTGCSGNQQLDRQHGQMNVAPNRTYIYVPWYLD